MDADPNKDSDSVPGEVTETGQGDVDADPNNDSDSVPDELTETGQDDVDADPNKDSDSVPDHGKIDKVVTDVDLDGNRKIKKEDGNVEGGTKKRSRKGAKEANTKRRESTRLKRKKEEESETDDSKKQKIDVPKIEEDDNDNGRKKTNTSRGHKTTRKTELKHEEDKKVVHKVPIDWIRDNQTKPPMSKETQKHPLMQAIYKRNPVPTNTDGNRSVCELCNKSFAHKRSLTGHLKLHYQTGKYNCTQCGRNFVNKNEYERHLTRHQDKRDFACVICDKAFKTTSGLKEHVDACRARVENDKSARIPCPECGKTFLTAASLRNHARSHVEIKWECVPCKKVYKQYISLWRHNNDHHNGKPAE